MGVVRDLCEVLRVQWLPPTESADHADSVEGDEPRPLTKPSRTPANVRALLGEKTEVVRIPLRNRIAMENMPSALADFGRLRAEEGEATHLLAGASVSHWAVMRHLVLLDSALDRWVSEDLYRRRFEGSFAGVSNEAAG